MTEGNNFAELGEANQKREQAFVRRSLPRAMKLLCGGAGGGGFFFYTSKLQRSWGGSCSQYHCLFIFWTITVYHQMAENHP